MASHRKGAGRSLRDRRVPTAGGPRSGPWPLDGFPAGEGAAVSCIGSSVVYPIVYPDSKLWVGANPRNCSKILI